MGTIRASQIIDDCYGPLHDSPSSPTRWPRAELLGYLNDALQDIPTLQPIANVVTANLQLAAGTLQEAPPDAIGFVRPIRNYSGVTPGRAVFKGDFDEYSLEDPDWHTADPEPEVVRYFLLEDDYTRFYVSPPQDGTGLLEIRYPALPDRLTDENQVIPISDAYRNPIYFYTLSRAFRKEIPQGSMEKANDYDSLYTRCLGLKLQAQGAARTKQP